MQVQTIQNDVRTEPQLSALEKLKTMRWKWTDEKIQKGVLRLYLTNDLLTGKRLVHLVAEVLPDGRVKMGEIH